ncbi:MAG: acyltransferase [Gammaproteobacteria bacterium]|nr:acyltransferase [Gammaproteobacteria bacterium]
MERFTLIDGLRGIAALMVVIFHLSQTVEATFSSHLPGIINDLIKSGHFGVEIFFVISGFVIAHSVRNGNWSFHYLANFGLRRSIRLDPPYWTIIVLEIGLIYLSQYFYPNLGAKLPDTKQLVAHLFYLQELLGLGHLIPIFWTLCYEVQFYLVLVSALVLYTNLKKFTPDDNKIAFTLFSILGLLTFLVSLGIFLHFLPESIPGLFIDRWHQFFLGVLTWWCTISRGPRWLFIITCLFTISALFFAPDVANLRIGSTIVILVVCILIYIAATTNNLSLWLNSPKLLFLGTISYGLYLVHPSVGWRLIALEKKIFGDDMSLIMASLALSSGIFVSILAAWLLHILVERPSMNFAHRIRLSKKAPVHSS